MLEIAGNNNQKLIRTLVAHARQGRRAPIADGELGDWQRADVQQGLPLWLKAHQGWVYLAGNDSFPGLFKIGCTRKTVTERMATLNASGVVAPWQALHQWPVFDAFGVEAQVHAALFRRKVLKEFFLGPSNELCAEIAEAINKDAQLLNTQLSPFLGGTITDFYTRISNEPQ